MVQIRQTERRIKVLDLLRQGMTETKIAKELDVGRNTIVRDVRWLKQNFVHDLTLITNQIMDRLQSHINDMNDRDLIALVSKLLPQKIETAGKLEVELSWGEDVTAKATKDKT